MAGITIQQAFDAAMEYSRSGRLIEAERIYMQILAQEPGNAEAYGNLGNVLAMQRRLDEAITAYRRAIRFQSNPYLSYNLANALRETGHEIEAIAAYREAIAILPDFIEAQINLGITLASIGQMDEAQAALGRGIARRPNSAEAHNTLGNVFRESGDLDQAIAAYQRALVLKPDFNIAHSNLLLDMHYHSNLDAAAIAREHRCWNQQHSEPLKRHIEPHASNRDPQRRLRVGYVSPDLRDHVVGRFLFPLLAHHDHQSVEVFAYAQIANPDVMSRRLQEHTDVWRSLVGLSDLEAARLIRQDQIDILVDLAGHTANNRLLVFAQKPAPVQVTYLGYPDSTGLSSMDYRLTDNYADPPGQTEIHHSEKLIRLATCAWCFEPAHSPPIDARREGPITFGCFNALAKITAPMLALWGRILEAVPDSILLLKAAGLSSPGVRQRVLEVIQKTGVSSHRIELHGRVPDAAEHLRLYGRVDIALDTFPYHGTTTTCEALWMGVPVVSLAGSSHVSRVGVSLLNNAGLPELVANTPEEYVDHAMSLAGDRSRLAQLRSTLRQRMEASALMDAKRYAREIESAYRQMWRQWCAKPD